MRNRFSKKHKGLKMSEHIEKCKVQLVFKGWLQKDIQVEENEDMEVDCEGDSTHYSSLKLTYIPRQKAETSIS